MKILLTTLNAKYSHTNISLYYLKEKISNICDCDILNFTINDNLNHILGNILSKDYDIICFGCYIWNIEYTLKLCSSINALKPNIRLVLGGPEVSFNPKEVLNIHPYISTIICNEAENSIKQLVQDYENNNLKSTYDIHVTDLDIPEISDHLISNYDGRVVYFETTRGCPYRCSYCLSCLDKSIKYIPNAKKQLIGLLEKNVNQIRFIDRTFNFNKKRAIELWRFLIENRKSTTFHFEICPSLLDAETLLFLKTVPKDVFQFEIGIQSTNKKAILSINRQYMFEKEREAIQELVSFGNIKIHADLIIGLPHEGYLDFKKSFNDLYVLKPDEIQLGFLKFLKGTDIYTKKDEYKYIHTEFPPYEILQNNFISFSEIQKLKKFEVVFNNIYNSGYFKYTLAYIEKHYSCYFTLFEDIADYMDKYKLFERKVSIQEFYTLIYDFCKTKEKDSAFLNILNQSLTYDYFLKFNGTRDWFFNKYSTMLKDLCNEYIEKNRNILFNNQNNMTIYKQNRFLILDYDFVNHNYSNAHIYISKK